MTPEQRAEAVRLLERWNVGPVRPYSTYDFGRERDTNCVSGLADMDEVGLYAMELADEVPTGLVVFAGTDRWLGEEQHPGQAELVVGAGKNQFDILRLARTDAANYDKTTEDIIQKLSVYDADYGIVIFGATTDTVRFVLTALPEDMMAFANDVYDFCPDIVDQGVGSVQGLADEIARYQALTLWWD
jgi:hypothetical protein